MGRHTAEPQSVRAPRQGDSRTVIGERRAARLASLGTANTAAEPTATTTAPQATPNPVSVAQSRVSEPTKAAPAARIVKVRRAPAPKAPRSRSAVSANSFVRQRATVPALSFFAVAVLGVGSLVNPLQADIASAAVIAPTLSHTAPSQQYTAHGTYASADTSRDAYNITKPAPVVVATPTTTTSSSSSSKSSSATAPAAGTPDPGSAKAIALAQVTARGWGTDQYNCLVSLWNRESGWNVYAYNPSGAYGIPQALPGSKMSTVGADWQTNPATQITWGLNYITGSYGTPCGAWAHSESFNWY